jgi:hypothetical protein
MGTEQGNSIGVFDAMRGDIRDKEGKIKCGEVKGRLCRGVLVEDCIATTGAMVRMGCDGEGGLCK